MMPYNFAAIDIGTNSFHLIVAKIKGRGNFEVIDKEREVIRLSEGSSGDIKEIKPSAVERAVHTLKNFKGIAESHHASIRAVATSAVREALNQKEFIKRIFEETGIEIEVVSGHEEARLIYLGVLKAVPFYKNRILCIDVGGGSTEFIIGSKGKIEFSMSHKIGAVRMSQRFFPDGIITKSRIQECRKWIEGEIYPTLEIIRKYNYEFCVGSSGTIMSVGSILLKFEEESEATATILNNYELFAADLRKVEKKIFRKKTTADRKKIKGLDTNRADIIPAGVIILSTLFEKIGIKRMTISNYALREGILLDTLQKMKSPLEKPKLEEIRLESVKNLAEKSNYDHEHCTHVARLALRLYDQLKEIHKLDNVCREYLEAAARLHDIGYQISHTQHHWHSNYIIRNSELLGFNDNEINIIANIARYHRKSHPKPRHKEFAVLSEKSQDIVRKLSAILRIADSLDRTHRKRVNDICVNLKDHIIELKLKYKDSLPEIELWNLDRRKGLFEEVYGRKIFVKH